MLRTALRACGALTRLSLAALLAACLFAGSAGTAALLAAPAPAQAAEAGVNLNSLEPSALAQATALGVHWIRVFAPWPDLEPSPGVHSAYWLGQYDRLLDSLPKGDHAIVSFVDTPSWESGSSAPNAPPSNPADYANILHFLAGQWQGKVAAYEIWNEEDAPLWWAGAPNPAAYTQLLQAAYPAVKSADPAAKVVLGGLTGNDYDFLEGVYKAGGKGYFEAIGVHTDTACDINSPFAFLRDNDGQIDEDSFIGYREVHATEIANGDDVPIWMTEMSWRTTSAECSEGAFAGQKPEGVSEAQQASYLTEAYHCLAQAPYVKLGLWYPIEDEGAVVSGLERANRSHKPSYAAMRAYVKHGDRMTGACGDLWIRVRASDSTGIESIRLLYDGHSIRNFDPFVEGKGYPKTVLAQIHWMGARHISLGRHTLEILAYDKLKNVTRKDVTIVHMPEGSYHHR
jgi:hypothetical protein